MADFTVSRHFMASALSFWAKWELQSHTRGVLLSLAPACRDCVDQFAARGSRTSRTHDAWLRTHQNVRSRGFFTGSRAHDQHRQQTVGQTTQTVGKIAQETSKHWILPVLLCESRSRTTCSRFHRLHQEVTTKKQGCLRFRKQSAHPPVLSPVH